MSTFTKLQQSAMQQVEDKHAAVKAKEAALYKKHSAIMDGLIKTLHQLFGAANLKPEAPLYVHIALGTPQCSFMYQTWKLSTLIGPNVEVKISVRSDQAKDFKCTRGVPGRVGGASLPTARELLTDDIMQQRFPVADLERFTHAMACWTTIPKYDDFPAYVASNPAGERAKPKTKKTK
jgi:hypothetical protein